MGIQKIVDSIMIRNPLAPPHASISEQTRAIKERGRAFDKAFEDFPELDEAFPDGFWEQGGGNSCLCESGPSGHRVGAASGCLFRDGQKHSTMCENCRRPCDVEVKREREWRGYYGSAQAYEDWVEIRSACCRATVVLPNGVELEEYDE